VEEVEDIYGDSLD